MKTLHIIIITVFLATATVLLTTSHHAYASTCAVQETIYSAPEFFLLSDNVFVGNVTSITDYGNHQWQVHFNIEKIWKGTATRQTSTVMAHTLQACCYSITIGEKYLIYTNGSPSTINPIYSKMYSDAQNDIALFDDPKFQSEEKIKEDLNKELDVAKGRVGSMMMDKSSHIPINGVGVDEVNSTLDIMIDDERATLSVEQYTQNLKNILGDIPITVEFGHATTLMPILHSVEDQGITTSHPLIHGSNSSNVLKSPLQQFKSGIKPEYVKCNQNLHLIIKAKDGSFACVTIETGKNLAIRGWATTFGTGISTNDYYTKCDTLYPQSDTGIAVLYMPTNSIGKICVKYSNPNDTPVPIVGGIRIIFDQNNSYLNATGITTWIGSTDNMIPKGDSTMVYWVKTGNQTGFYGLRFVCGATPFAVGYDNNSKIVSNDFPFVGVTHSCPVMLYDVKIEGLSGIGVKYIPFP